MGEIHYVHGPPGTGKTYFLQRKVEQSVDEYGADKVLVCSLTKTAAGEILARGVNLPKGQVGTLHSICFRALGVTKDMMVDESDKALESFNAENPRWYVSKDDARDVSKGKQLLHAYGLMRCRMVPPDEYVAKASRCGGGIYSSLVHEFVAAYEAWKQSRELRDFTDLLTEALAWVKVAPGSPAVILCDEAQDFSALEGALIRQWAEAAELTYLVGDPNQSIFVWRGADPEIFSAHPVDPENEIVLSQSYRVPRAVHAYAQRVIERLESRDQSMYLPRDEEGEVVASGATFREPAALLREIEEAESRGEEVLILAYSASQLSGVLRMMREQGIPFHNPWVKVWRGGGVSNANVAVWNPLRVAAPGRDGARPPVSAADWLVALFGDQTGQPMTFEDARRWTEPLGASGAPLKVGAKAWLASRPGAENMDMDELFRWFALGELDPAFLALTHDDVKARLRWYLRAATVGPKVPRLAYPAAIVARYGPSRLRATPNVIVSTIHGAKGRQAPVVIVLPDLAVPTMDSLERPDVRDEAIRCAYVAATRAERRLVICRYGHRRSEVSSQRRLFPPVKEMR